MTIDTVNAKALARYGADRLCLWCLCGKAACLRALACRGDPGHCAGLMGFWLEALAAVGKAAPTFAEMERRIESPEEMRLYRAWRDLLARAEEDAKSPPAETELLRGELLRRIEALGRQQAADRQS